MASTSRTLSVLSRYGKTAFLITASAVVAVFLYVSTGLVRDLSEQERVRMEIWADATREIARLSISTSCCILSRVTPPSRYF